MKNKFIGKVIVFGIVILFIEMSIIPVNANTEQNKANNENPIVKTADHTVYNLIGVVNISFHSPWKKPPVKPPMKIEWRWEPDRNFTYPIHNGTVKVNYTLKVQISSDGLFFIPRLVMVITQLFLADIELGDAWFMTKVWIQKLQIVKYLYVESSSILTPSNGTEFLVNNWVTVFTPIPPHFFNISNKIISFRADFIPE
jgi:hypothetical protein